MRGQRGFHVSSVLLAAAVLAAIASPASAGVRRFQVTGVSDASLWEWSLSGGLSCSESSLSVTSGGDCADVVAVWVQSINNQCGSGTAAQSGCLFTLQDPPLDSPSTLNVANNGGPSCTVTFGVQCQFNPYVTEVASAPGVSSAGLILIAVLVVTVGTALIFYGRRSRQAEA